MQWQPEIPTTKPSHLPLLRHQVWLIRVIAKDFCQVLGFVSCNIQVENHPNRSPAWLRLQRIREILGGREIWRSLSDHLLEAGLCPTPDQVSHGVGSPGLDNLQGWRSPHFPEYLFQGCAISCEKTFPDVQSEHPNVLEKQYLTEKWLEPREVMYESG